MTVPNILLLGQLRKHQYDQNRQENMFRLISSSRNITFGPIHDASNRLGELEFTRENVPLNVTTTRAAQVDQRT
jgi:hypothetical protein